MASPTLHLSPQFDDEEYMEESEVFAVNAGRHLQELQRLSAFQQVTTKVPPAYDGRSSWFAYEDAIDDWVDITELETEKQGPALRNRLEGEAAIHKRLLDRDRLKDKVNGVRYFKSYLSLRPLFVKGASNVFLYRFQQLMTLHRGNGDMLRWITRFQLSRSRMQEAWDDTYVPITELNNPDRSCLRYLPVTRRPSDDHCRGRGCTDQREVEEAAFADHSNHCQFDRLDVRILGRSHTRSTTSSHQSYGPSKPSSSRLPH